MRRHPNVVNIEELESFTQPAPDPFGGSCRRVAAAAGGHRLGATLFEVPAGASAIPCHAHLNNEEALFILEGSGTMLIGEDTFPVRKGDWVSLLAGHQYAHQLIADRGEALRYLMVSTMEETDIIVYPTSGKMLPAWEGFGLFGGPKGGRKIFHIRDGEATNFWDGEAIAPPLVDDAKRR